MAMEAPSATGLRIVLHQRTAGPVSVSSHADRDRIISVVKAVLTKDEHPENFALQAVQEAIKPQKQTVLVQDENQLLENALRTLMQELVSTAVKSSQRMLNHGQIPRLLDIVLYLCEKGHVEGGMIFQLLEDLIEMSTIKDCKEVFGYIETKQDTLGKQELFGRGKLVMLRTCNQLLRRLSKSNDVIFCGRILMFLAHVFPLSERSAVNIKGVFNTSNETKYEKEPPQGVSIDFNFYKTLWSLQEHFCNPGPTTLTQPKWQKFSSILMVVLDTFEAQPLSEDEGKANNIEQEEESSFSIKYLTSTNLMGLELKDPSFRRHILLQCLILFDYLKAPGKSEKDGPSDSMKEEIKSCEERVKKLLEGLPPKGKEFLQSIEHILEREKNWVWWKRDGCQAYEKQPTEKKTIQEKPRKRKKMRLGNKELHNLWTWADKNPDVMTDEKRVKMPSINEYWKPLAEDMDPSAGIEAEYHHKNKKVYCWKGLRFSLRQDLESFCRYTDLGIGVEGVVPQDLLPADVRTKIHSKPADKNNNKRAKREEPKVPQVVAASIVEDLEEGEAVMESDIITESNKPSPDDVESGEAIRSENEADIEYTSKN